MNTCLMFIVIIAPILDSIPIERRARFKPRASGDGRQEEVLFQLNLTKPLFHLREPRDTKKGAGYGYDPFKESRANITNDTSDSKDSNELLEDEVPPGDESFPPVDTKYTGYIVVPAITVGAFVLLLLALAIILRPSGCFCNNFLKKPDWVPYSKRKMEEKKAVKEKEAKTAIDDPKKKRGKRPIRKGRTVGERRPWWSGKKRRKYVPKEKLKQKKVQGPQFKEVDKKDEELLKEKTNQEKEALAREKALLMTAKKTPGHRKVKKEPRPTPRQPPPPMPASTPHAPPPLMPPFTPHDPPKPMPPLTPHAPPSPVAPFTSKKPVLSPEFLATASQASMDRSSQRKLRFSITDESESPEDHDLAVIQPATETETDTSRTASFFK